MSLFLYIRRFYALTAGIRVRLMLCMLMGVLRVALGLVLIYFSKQLIDIATRVISGDIYRQGVLLMLCFVGEIVMGVISSYLTSQTDIRLKNKLRYRLFSRQLDVIFDGRKAMHTGNIMSRIEEDVRVVAEMMSSSVSNTVVALVHLLGAFCFLCQLDITFAIIVSSIMPICVAGAKCYAWKMKQLTAGIRSCEGDIQGVIQESLQHSLMIKALCRAEQMRDRLYGLQDGLYGKVMQRTRFSLFSRTMMAFGFTGGYMVTFLWGAMELNAGTITFGVMTAFLQLVGQVQRPVLELSRLLPSFIHAAASLDRLDELEALPVEENCTFRRMDGKVGLRVEQMDFAYPDEEKYIFKGFSHDFTPGSRTAILGETGTGKSTLVKLLLALLTPRQGRLEMYNDRGERCGVTPAVRPNFIYVPQGNSLMSGTIRSNLLLGNPDADEADMRKALHTAAADFVFDQPLGLDTPCSEGGKGLSDGQAQRIAVARALLSEGSVLLFDEFSSALDIETERLLIERLNHSYPGKTMIFITHRQEVVGICNETIRL